MRIKSILKNSIGLIPTMIVKTPKLDEMMKEEWIINLSHLYQKTIKTVPSISLYHFTQKYVDVIKNVIEKSPEMHRELKKKWLSYFNTWDDADIYFLTKIIIISGLLDNDFSKAIIDYAYKTSDMDYAYYSIMDISMETFRYSAGYYPDFYIDRRRNLLKLADAFELKHSEAIPNTDEKKRVCIVTYMLAASIKNSMQRVTAMVANALNERDIKVTVVCLDSFYIPKNEKKKIYECYNVDLSKKNADKICSMFNDGIDIIFSDNVNYKVRYQNALDVIYKECPNAIVELTDENSVLSSVYTKDFPVYYIPMRSNSTSMSFSYILGQPWKYEEGNKRFNSIDIGKVKKWMFPEFVPEVNRKFTKSDLKLGEDSFIILSIGNNNHGFSSEFENTLCDFIKNNDKIIWLLVGNNASDNVKINHYELIQNGKIIEWGFENELAGLCYACDIHLRSDITGGSGATAFAAMAGIPIVMRSQVCDPMRWLGRDFSKLNTDCEIISEIEKLYYDKTYYKTQSDLVKDKVSLATNANYWWDKLYDIVIKQ